MSWNRIGQCPRRQLWPFEPPRCCGDAWVCALPILVTASLLFGSGCTPKTGTSSQAEFEIDGTIHPSQTKLAGLDHGPSRPVGVMVGPDGKRLEFVSNEIILHPSSQEELQNFINTYGATVLRDGTPLLIPGVEHRSPATSSGWYLLRIDTKKSSLDDLKQNLTAAGFEGKVRFSSEDTTRTLALFARERSRGIGINPIMSRNASLEHPTGPTGNIDAEMFPWFTEDDDPALPGDQGLSTGVTHAWDYLSYKGILEVPGTYYVPKIAIIDSGFDLDETTGVPLNGNLDYNTLLPPIQMDIVDHDGTAGGENLLKCGGIACPWHGQGSFGIAAAYPKNLFGSAGTAGHFVRPMLVKEDGDGYTIADAIRSAVINGADVVSISISGGCGDFHWFCSIPPDDIYEMFELNVRLARSFLVPVVAAAGNDGVDITDEDVYPCKTEGVICVGSVDGNKMNRFNFGTPVDIWAPTNMRTTVTPESAVLDANNFGLDELALFDGTSASTPFVAGVIGLMKSANANAAPPIPPLSVEQVLSILQSTANSSPDLRVTKGYIDAYRAVRGLLVNELPSVVITSPLDNATYGWKTHPLFTVNYSDPEVSPANIYRWHGEVVYSSNLDGELCRSASPPYTCSSTRDVLTLGAHIMTATATDAHGATAMQQRSINIVNRPPDSHIVWPLSTDTLYSHIPVLFGASVSDPDGETIPEASVRWDSSKDSFLGTGREIAHKLTAGSHTISVTATDGKGLTAQDQVMVNVIGGDGLPLPTITAPADHIFISPGTVLTLSGQASDPEDGTLTGASLEWRSNIDGLLGSGTDIQATLSGPPVQCNPESIPHTITLKAKDSDGHEVSVKITVWVGIIC